MYYEGIIFHHKLPSSIPRISRLCANFHSDIFFISPYIVPPVSLQTISALRSLLMACRKCIQWFFSYL